MNNSVNKTICEENICVGCGVCANVCAKKCIEMKKSNEGFLYPVVNISECTNCNACVIKCPQNSVAETDKSEFYMAWHKNKDVLRKSSSGGVFTALADAVLNGNGVVAGAYYDCSTREVQHIIIDTKSELDKLRLSKYYQSNTQNIFVDVKKMLANNKRVLFSGTACQIAALKSYLGGNHANLLTVDVLCHGVASKKIVDEYIADKQKRYKKKITDYRFRVKDEKSGWQDGYRTGMQLFFEDGTSRIQDKLTDTFFVGFNNNLFLRESCYNCKYCGQDRVSDFTIADFWGVSEERANEIQQNLGVSLMLVNSDKARDLLVKLKQDLYYEKIDPQEAIPYNLALVKPQPRPETRGNFFEIMEKSGFDKAVKSLMKKYYFKCNVKRMIKLFLGENGIDKLKKFIKH